MNNVVLEISGKYAVLLSEAGDVVRVKNRDYTVGQRVQNALGRTNALVKWAVTAAAAVVLLFGGTQFALHMPYAEVSLDVNPGIEITTNMFNTIIEVSAMNEDAQRVISHANLKGQKLQAGLTSLFAALVEGKYLTADEAATMMVTAYSPNTAYAVSLVEEMIQTMQREAANHQVLANFKGESVDGELKARAQRYGVTPGKLLLAERYVKSVKNATEQDLIDSLKKSVDELIANTDLLYLPDVNLESGDRSVLLSGYPLEVLPLYKCARVEGSSFTHNTWEGVGADEYFVTYLTDTFPQDVLTYYNKLLTSRSYANEISLSGTIGNYQVSIISRNTQSQTRVTLIVSLHSDTNPYFANAPDTIKILGGDKNKPAYTTYLQRWGDPIKVTYETAVITELTLEELTTLYIDEYGNKEGFEKISSDMASDVQYRFIEGGYIYEVCIQKRYSEYDIPLLTIYCMTP